ncbi:hypothetical protein AVEN_189554-1 [Araneus ventricosus]|uniref:Uncharacterized protein n=1 Tax=Araneus ventricosus TaxID=182803 RepID=A0A4Y2UMG7_ARAVE|nr:hypothetical protein AVEN_189554-1 [Araneus ventricosus]
MRSDLNAYRFLLLLDKTAPNRDIEKIPVLLRSPNSSPKSPSLSPRSRVVPHAQIATSTYAHGESDEKEKRQAGVNKYRAQKIVSSTHARGDSRFVGDAIIQTDRQSTF